MSAVAAPGGRHRWQLAASGLPVLGVATVLLFALHIAVGAKPLALATVVEAIVARDATIFDHMIIWDLRLPRALIAITVGAALSVAGALMQGVTRNPLAASPKPRKARRIGVIAGASFMVAFLLIL